MPSDADFNESALTKKYVFWDQIEKSGIEEYDESFLANLRSELKELEGNVEKIIIVPKRFSGKDTFWGFSDSEVMSEEAEVDFFDNFTSAMVHLARRIKDCKNIAGFSYPDFENDWNVLGHYANDYKKNFMTAFQKKHSHYIFID